MEHVLAMVPVAVLAVATAAVALAIRLGLSPVLGYLAAGLLIGPAGLGWLGDGQASASLAEVGVILLMFTLGLEFSLPRLLAAKRLVLGAGGLQVVSAVVVFGLVSWWWSGSLAAALLIGAALAMSSTAVVLKQLGEQRELPMAHGRTATSILLFQDLAAVAVLAVLPILAAEPARPGLPLLLALAQAGGVFVLLVVVGRRLLPPLLYWVASMRSLELFMLTALLLALSAAAVSAAAGLSATLGGFMAGMLLGETPFRHQIEATVRPFRDLMLGFFFATIGMQLDPGVLVAMPGAVAAVLLAVVAGKALLLAPLLRALGQPAADAGRAAVSLAQGGELGLLVVSRALALGLLGAETAQPLFAGLVLSMAVAPVLIRFNARLGSLIAGPGTCDTLPSEARIAAGSEGIDGHVIVCGYGRLGQNLMRLLAEEGVAAVALDLDHARVRQAEALGEPVFFGNALQPGVLQAAGLERARALAVTMEDPDAALRILTHVRSLGSELPVLVRSGRGVDDEVLAEAGATLFPEGLETSLAFAGQLLILLGFPPSRVEARQNAIRAADYAPLRVFFHDSGEPEAGLDAQDFPEQVRALVVEDGHHAAGRTAHELGFTEHGVELIDVRRGAMRVPGRLLDTLLRAGDVLLLKGTREALERAIARLVEGA
jgi:CPA2 family monovalent cation:H+ antiporter-2